MDGFIGFGSHERLAKMAPAAVLIERVVGKAASWARQQ